MPFDRDDAVDRYVIHSEILARYLHAQFQKLVERIAAEPVKQSYVFLGSYRPGAVLPRHRDRAQCEFSISFLADYVPDPTERPSGWPLYLEDPVRNTVSTVDLKVGDAVVYRGRELFHYRHALPAGHRSTSLFFHYVRPDFAGDLF